MVLVPALFASLLLNSFPQCSHSRHGCKRASVGLCVCFGVIWVGIVPPVRYPAVLPKSCQRYRVSCSTRLKGSFVFKLHHLCVLPFCVSTRKKNSQSFSATVAAWQLFVEEKSAMVRQGAGKNGAFIRASRASRTK